MITADQGHASSYNLHGDYYLKDTMQFDQSLGHLESEAMARL